MNKNEMVIKATLARNALESKNRSDNGERYICVKDDAPDWVTELCREAHDDMFPDDFVFETVAEALDAIIDQDGEADSVELEADCYNSDLLAWLGSHSSRVNYTDQAAEEFGTASEGIINQIMQGQYLEKRQILGNVVSFLENLDLEEMDGAE
jgi:hypothetical protein